jgi:hypothetical protein
MAHVHALIETKYKQHCENPSDIHEHLPTLNKYAKECPHITECGVRSAVSTWAFLAAGPQRLVSVDLFRDSNVDLVEKASKEANISFTFHQASDLECPMEQTDLLFIDTWHVYGHLKRELKRWHSRVSKYIMMHDTTVDAVYGETIRSKWDAAKQSRETGIPVAEIQKGLWPAIEEFIAENTNWVLHERYENNNGLTILKRI